MNKASQINPKSDTTQMERAPLNPSDPFINHQWNPWTSPFNTFNHIFCQEIPMKSPWPPFFSDAEVSPTFISPSWAALLPCRSCWATWRMRGRSRWGQRDFWSGDSSTATSLEIIVSKGNHPKMALIQVSEILLFTQNSTYPLVMTNIAIQNGH